MKGWAFWLHHSITIMLIREANNRSSLTTHAPINWYRRDILTYALPKKTHQCPDLIKNSVHILHFNLFCNTRILSTLHLSGVKFAPLSGPTWADLMRPMSFIKNEKQVHIDDTLCDHLMVTRDTWRVTSIGGFQVKSQSIDLGTETRRWRRRIASASSTSHVLALHRSCWQ